MSGKNDRERKREEEIKKAPYQKFSQAERGSGWGVAGGGGGCLVSGVYDWGCPHGVSGSGEKAIEAGPLYYTLSRLRKTGGGANTKGRTL